MATKEELLQAAKDKKDQPKIDAAYEASLTSTEMAPKSGDFDSYRKQKQGEIAGRKAANAAAEADKSEKLSKAQYDRSVRKYERELALDPPDKNPVGYKLRKFEDAVGDKVRSAGAFFGSNRMTSQDDAAQMKARKDVKGYAKGGSVSSASSRADGCAQRGKTRGMMV